MQKNEMRIVDRRFEWRQRAARYLLEAMGAEFDSWDGCLSHDPDAGHWVWFKVFNRQNCASVRSLVKVFWPKKKALGRYFSNHIWRVCMLHEIELLEKEDADSSD